MNYLFYGKVEQGELITPRGLDWKNYLDSLEGKKVMITVELEKSKRSLDQNAYLWVIYGYIADTTGYLATEIHEILKRKLLPPKFITYKNQEIKLPRSTTELSISEMMAYIDSVKLEAEDLGIIVPNREDLST